MYLFRLRPPCEAGATAYRFVCLPPFQSTFHRAGQSAPSSRRLLARSGLSDGPVHVDNGRCSRRDSSAVYDPLRSLPALWENDRNLVAPQRCSRSDTMSAFLPPISDPLSWASPINIRGLGRSRPAYATKLHRGYRTHLGYICS